MSGVIANGLSEMKLGLVEVEAREAAQVVVGGGVVWSQSTAERERERESDTHDVTALEHRNFHTQLNSFAAVSTRFPTAKLARYTNSKKKIAKFSWLTSLA